MNVPLKFLRTLCKGCCMRWEVSWKHFNKASTLRTMRIKLSCINANGKNTTAIGSNPEVEGAMTLVAILVAILVEVLVAILVVTTKEADKVGLNREVAEVATTLVVTTLGSTLVVAASSGDLCQVRLLSNLEPSDTTITIF